VICINNDLLIGYGSSTILAIGQRLSSLNLFIPAEEEVSSNDISLSLDMLQTFVPK
jgi:hypothetical protein